MFSLVSLIPIGIIYIVAAVLPAALLMFYIYRKDGIEKEPASLLIKLIGFGVLAALLSGGLETAGIAVLDRFISVANPLYLIILAFLIVAVVEEGTKYILMKAATWKNPHFNFRFDAVVYAAFISLGFAAFENIGYVMGYGLTIAPTRALLAIPGHLSFSVFMGFFYGRARLWANRGDEKKASTNRRLAYIVAVLLHGFYDACAMKQTVRSTLIFFAFIIAVDILMIRTIRKEAREDHPL
ncbi:MAG: PrsW family intramembrane metalloprotease [Firmicutes bacterium]|nr:PrsW family intramembrane metalloprotease [Bacillota bacterium]